MKVEVLGPGCKRCEALYGNAVAALSDIDSSINIEVEKASDVN
jgi:hypothetical protein